MVASQPTYKTGAKEVTVTRWSSRDREPPRDFKLILVLKINM